MGMTGLSVFFMFAVGVSFILGPASVAIWRSAWSPADLDQTGFPVGC